MQRKVVIAIHFNNMGINPDRLSRKWLEDRINLFRRLTLRSLKKQTNPNFLVVLKLAEGCTEIVEDILAGQEPLPDNIRFGTMAETDQMIGDYAKEAKELYVARIDSDDLYHETFVQQLYDYKPQPETVALVNCYGYMWNMVDGQMAKDYHKSPQFYTLIYSVPEFLAGYRVKIPGRGTHGNVIDLPHEIFPGRNYVNIIHSTNSSAKRIRSKDFLTQLEMEQVLSEFMTPD
ncbi:glycosyltransferase [Paenibacillus mesotrionivorans]|uniref:Glycosyltransferase n=1 Tax=Paenibacillus mesotrionivorans TaxID=3160968 RepID=A0ACC7P0J6_9BACL